MAGLIDGLRIDQSVYPGLMSYAHNGALNAVTTMLLSDETREALAEAIFQVVVDGPQPDGGIPSHMLADAVVRVLTGETPE
jgi:hypothetical protein